MPLPTLPAKLGATLSADEIKQAPKATPPKSVLTLASPTLRSTQSAQTAPKKVVSPAPASQATNPPTTPQPTAPKTVENTTTVTPAANKKLFVLDTNVLLHDSNCLFKFEEHDVFIPMIVLEELDHQKKGLSEVARNARQVSRHLEALTAEHDITQGIALNNA